MSKKDKSDKKKHKKKAVTEAAREAPEPIVQPAPEPKAKASAKRAARPSKRAAEDNVAAETSSTAKPLRVTSLPRDRSALLGLHRELRRKRDALPLLSEERAETVIELARVEVEVARIARAMDPPLV